MKSAWKRYAVCGFFSALIAILIYSISPPTPLDAQETLPKLKLSDPLPANLFIELAKVVNPTVVNISTTQMVQGYGGRGGGPYGAPGRDPMMDLFEQFMGGGRMMNRQPVQSLGTGFIIREDGLIITNNHVVDKADIIKVQLSEGSDELFEAEVIGKDERTDVALIKIDAKRKLPFAQLGKSADLQVGEWVAAFGNPYGHGHSLTKGIVSAIGRQIDEINLFPFIQTDASINPGNSGGPLVNSQGLVVGVNTAIDARAQGIGFAIPIDDVKAILPQLEKKGSIDRGFIGIAMADIPPESAKELGLKSSDGSLVRDIVPNSPAEKAGIKPYDFITEVNGKKIKSSGELVNSIQRLTAGTVVTLDLIRDGKKLEKKVTLGTQEGVTQAARKGKQKTYDGQKAPFDLGFKIADFSPQLADAFQIPPLRRGQPIVIEVTPGSAASKAGLAPGDVILDINKNPVYKAREVIKGLKKDANNLIRVLKRDRVVILYLRA